MYDTVMGRMLPVTPSYDDQSSFAGLLCYSNNNNNIIATPSLTGGSVNVFIDSSLLKIIHIFQIRTPLNDRLLFSIFRIAMSSESSPVDRDLHSEKSSLGPETTRESARTAFDHVPDGGFQAWLQVAAAFFIFMNTAGLFNSYGVYQGFYTQGPLKSISGSDISWIGSLQGCLMLLICIVTGPLYDMGYLHSLVNIGTFAIVFGMMMTSICHEYWHFVLAQGIVVGIGNGLLFLPSIAIVPQYFAKRKALASGIVAAGSSIGAFWEHFTR